MIYPVIMCGGSGTRLWPLSRGTYPKQFTKILDDISLFQQSALRTASNEFHGPVIVTSEQFRFIVSKQLEDIKISSDEIIIEPQPKNTAPALLASALYCVQKDENAVILAMPSDHVIQNAEAFRLAVFAALEPVNNGGIVTFGINPTNPETGYGYLELEKPEHALLSTPSKLASFVEKPNAEKAAQMLLSGKFLWNAGIFLFKARTLIQEFEKYEPLMLEQVEQAFGKRADDLNFTRISANEWGEIKGQSIDYAIMEKSDKVFVMPYHAGWSDLGGWSSVWQEAGPDESGTVTSQNAYSIDCKDTLLRSESEYLQLVGIGLEDIVAIAMPDAVVIAKKSESQRVKEAVDLLAKNGIPQATSFRGEHRPWGHFESLVADKRFQVKRISVHPGGTLSLQSHFHRAEHWIVVSGTAKVMIGEEAKIVCENESVYIPIGTKHRLENPGKVPVVLIEVQTGSYLGEDDIIRYEDIYSRK